MRTCSDSLALMLGTPRIALEPTELRPFLADAITAGGGVVVELAEADALIWADPNDPDRLESLLKTHPDIRWVQLPWAGIEPMVGVIDNARIWTCAKGVYGDQVAEHALGLALAGMRHIGAYARASEWSEQAGRSLVGGRVTILGAGGLARSLMRLLDPFDCRISVLRRHDEPFPGAEFTGTLDDLSQVLPKTDLLFLTLALTPQTVGVVDSQRLAELPDHAWIVNVARGRHIVTDDLVAALRGGVIGGAALDVTDPEPLPAGHPLWDLPNCIITPHTANTAEMAAPLLSRRITQNVRRFAEGGELLGIVDIDAGY